MAAAAGLTHLTTERPGSVSPGMPVTAETDALGSALEAVADLASHVPPKVGGTTDLFRSIILSPSGSSADNSRVGSALNLENSGSLLPLITTPKPKKVSFDECGSCLRRQARYDATAITHLELFFTSSKGYGRVFERHLRKMVKEGLDITHFEPLLKAQKRIAVDWSKVVLPTVQTIKTFVVARLKTLVPDAPFYDALK
jgi:hypothetical protein